MTCSRINNTGEYQQALIYPFQDGRSSSSAESRSLTSDNEERKSYEELFPVVIAAEPRQDPKEHAYSVYGSPIIDYSKLYTLPGVKLATHNEPLDDGRDAPYLAFQGPIL